ncbi:unnamed protein product [Pleuronectes platessa]|uniref:Uncharacterized protein n=1 Tax=Pleuronectes platessa TaxID=8262 RepID=A0A9N7YTE8_PLEPL|nr:unnamed protein product [Pleuronectes platessa]
MVERSRGVEVPLLHGVDQSGAPRHQASTRSARFDPLGPRVGLPDPSRAAGCQMKMKTLARASTQVSPPGGGTSGTAGRRPPLPLTTALPVPQDAIRRRQVQACSLKPVTLRRRHTQQQPRDGEKDSKLPP